MDNPFKNLINNYEVPEVLKQKVLNDINLIKLSLDMADLFMVKYPNTIGDLLNSKDVNSDKNKTN
jgi:hypothetical protein